MLSRIDVIGSILAAAQSMHVEIERRPSAMRCVSCACCYLDIAPAEISEVPECAGEHCLEPYLVLVSVGNE